MNNWLTSIVQCDVLYDRVNNVMNSPGNLIGVAKAVNGLKKQFFQLSSKGNMINVGFGSFLRAEAEATLQYLNYIQPNWLNTARRLGGIMDDIWHAAHAPGPAGGDPPSLVFTRYATTQFNSALARLNAALNGGTNWVDGSTFPTKYKKDELR